MFNNPFSFAGRIRRTEYGISLIIYFFAYAILMALIEGGGVETSFARVLLFAFIPMLWFLWAQGAKRCHDLGNSGWFMLIPFYVLWMLFAGGEPGVNKYGCNPKGIDNSTPETVNGNPDYR